MDHSNAQEPRSSGRSDGVPRDFAPLPPDLDCWYLAGPTAAGKTAVGIQIAQRLNAEIVSLDSMAVYRGMDIGTAKPSPEQRQLVPHHLIDVRDPCEEFSLSNYLELAHDLARRIRGRGRQVLFVGGTPLYLKAMLRGLYQGPPPDWDFRRSVEEEARQVGLEALHDRLAMVDPLSAAKLHPHDVRRIIRALEVYRLTGQPLSHQQLQFEEGRSAEQCRVFVLGWSRRSLHQRIDRRVDRMFENDLVGEVRGLLDKYGELSRTASQAVGYREVIEHLKSDRPLDQTRQRVKVRTHQFAKRQETWFRSLSECRRIVLDEHTDLESIAKRVVDMGRETPVENE